MYSCYNDHIIKLKKTEKSITNENRDIFRYNSEPNKQKAKYKGTYLKVIDIYDKFTDEKKKISIMFF